MQMQMQTPLHQMLVQEAMSSCKYVPVKRSAYDLDNENENENEKNEKKRKGRYIEASNPIRRKLEF